MDFFSDILNNNPIIDVVKNITGDLGDVAKSTIQLPQNVIGSVLGGANTAIKSVVGGANTAVKDVVGGAKDVANNTIDKTANSVNNITSSLMFPVLIAGGLFIVYEIYNSNNNMKTEIIRKI